MAGDSEAGDQARFPCPTLIPPPTSPKFQKGSSGKGMSCRSGVLVAEEPLRWLFFREAGLTAGKSGMEGQEGACKGGGVAEWESRLPGEEMEGALLVQGEGCPYQEQGELVLQTDSFNNAWGISLPGPWRLVGMPYSSSIHTILPFIGLSNWQGIDSNNEYLLCA